MPVLVYLVTSEKRYHFTCPFNHWWLKNLGRWIIFLLKIEYRLSDVDKNGRFGQ